MEFLGDFLNVIETVGVWGLIGVVIALVIYENHKHRTTVRANKSETQNKIDIKNADTQNQINISQNKNQELIDMEKTIQEHDAKYFEMFKEFAENILLKANSGVVHTVEDEERN